MFDDLRKASKDDPIEVEIEFADKVEVRVCELVVRKSGSVIGTFNASFQEQKSVLEDGYSFTGYSFSLAPSVLAESYLSVGIKGAEHHYYIPLLRFIPDRHIEKEAREASPDYRDDVSKIYYRTWPIKPAFLQRKDEVKEGEDPFAGAKPSGILAGKNKKEALRAQGVTFPAGSVIYYGLPASQLAVRNTEDNLKKIDRIVKELNR